MHPQEAECWKTRGLGKYFLSVIMTCAFLLHPKRHTNIVPVAIVASPAFALHPQHWLQVPNCSLYNVGAIRKIIMKSKRDQPLGTQFLLTLPVALIALFSPQSALAQDGLMADKSASEGTTEVAVEGFQGAAEQGEERRLTSLKLAGGALIAAGNSRSLAATGSANLRVLREANQYTADFSANYARSAAESDAPLETTVENYQGRLRYDRFLSERWSLFISLSGRHDQFQGLDLRANIDPGAAYYFLTAPKHRLWIEGGYDMQYDLRDDAALLAGEAEGIPLDRSEVRHAARGFFGYENTLNERVTFDTGLEYLQAFDPTKNWRINWQGSLTSAIAGRFSMATTIGLKYDNNPLPDIEKFDALTSLNLVYTLL